MEVVFMAQRIRRCDNRKEFERLIDDFITQGYTVVSRGDSSASLAKYKKKEHLKVLFLTGWWTFGIGNLVYAFMKPKVEDEVLVRIETT